jgi:hypothetical protein
MARGTVVNEPVTSQATTDAYREGLSRIYGDKPVKKGRWIWDADAQRLISASEFIPRYNAKDAPIITGRIHEGVTSPIDGSDIGTRAKRKAHMRQHDLIDKDDAPPAVLDRIKKDNEWSQDRKRREAMQQAARKLYSQGKWE